jgi:hypothetical protein
MENSKKDPKVKTILIFTIKKNGQMVFKIKLSDKTV